VVHTRNKYLQLYDDTNLKGSIEHIMLSKMVVTMITLNENLFCLILLKYSFVLIITLQPRIK